jgi:hypothetical protein
MAAEILIETGKKGVFGGGLASQKLISLGD